MSPSELRSRLQGVVGFPVTPFNADLSLDLDGLRRNLRAMLQHPPAAIVAAGGTGELYSLSPRPSTSPSSAPRLKRRAAQCP